LESDAHQVVPQYSSALDLPPKQGECIQREITCVVVRFEDLSEKDKLIARLHSSVFPHVSRTVREEFMDIVNNPHFAEIPKSRQGLKSAKEQVAHTVKMPMLHGKRLNGKKMVSNSQTLKVITQYRLQSVLGFVNIVEWVEYCYSNCEWAQLMQTWTNYITKDGYSYELWDSSLFWQSTIQGLTTMVV